MATELKAFSRARPMGTLGRAIFALETGLALTAYHRRAHRNGHALCLLGPRYGRVVMGAAGILLAVGILGALAPVVGEVVVAVVVVILLPSLARAVGDIPASLRLHRLSPPGRHVYLHSLASTQAGAGAELLRSVGEEADQKGWSIVLDADSEGLVAYYQRHGFTALGGPVPSPGGRRRVRMWRPPGPGPQEERCRAATHAGGS